MSNDTTVIDIILGLVIVALVASAMIAIFLPREQAPSHETHGEECVIITQNETLLVHPEYGEDDGMVYCPTGEVSVSQLGRVIRD